VAETTLGNTANVSPRQVVIDAHWTTPSISVSLQPCAYLYYTSDYHVLQHARNTTLRMVAGISYTEGMME
jgi:hypothetical protein